MEENIKYVEYKVFMSNDLPIEVLSILNKRQTPLNHTAFIDIEDTFQFVVSQKMRCQYIITENVKDFKTFQNVRIIRPKEIRRIIF